MYGGQQGVAACITLYKKGVIIVVCVIIVTDVYGVTLIVTLTYCFAAHSRHPKICFTIFSGLIDSWKSKILQHFWFEHPYGHSKFKSGWNARKSQKN